MNPWSAALRMQGLWRPGAIRWTAVLFGVACLVQLAHGAEPSLTAAQTFAAGTAVPAALPAAQGASAVPSSCDSQRRLAPTAENARATKLPTIAAASSKTIGFGDAVEVTLTDSADFFNCLYGNSIDPVLFVDHVPLPSLKPVDKVREPDGSVKLRYRLTRNGSDATHWDELLLRAWRSGGGARQVPLGVGNTSLYESAVQALEAGPLLQLSLFATGPAFAWVMLLLSLGAAALLLHFTEMLRDREPNDRNPSANAAAAARAADQPNSQRSISLARLLLTGWAFTAMACLAVAVATTGSAPPLTGTIGWLLGLGGATAASGTAVNSFRDIGVRPSQGLWRDIVTDADGLAIHRLQALLVNVLLLGIVWSQLISLGSIANLDSGWSALLGISSATYAFGKMTETVFPK